MFFKFSNENRAYIRTLFLYCIMLMRMGMDAFSTTKYVLLNMNTTITTYLKASELQKTKTKKIKASHSPAA